MANQKLFANPFRLKKHFFSGQTHCHSKDSCVRCSIGRGGGSEISGCEDSRQRTAAGIWDRYVNEQKTDYDFVILTEHDVSWDLIARLNEKPGKINGLESSEKGIVECGTGMRHMLCLGLPNADTRADQSVRFPDRSGNYQEKIDAVAALDGISVLAHPYSEDYGWRTVSKFMKSLANFHGLEIENASSSSEDNVATREIWKKWHSHPAHRRIWGFAGDDFHGHDKNDLLPHLDDDHLFGRTRITVNANSLTRKELVKNMRDGNFTVAWRDSREFAFPTFEDIRFTGGVIEAKVRNCDKVLFRTHRRTRQPDTVENLDGAICATLDLRKHGVDKEPFLWIKLYGGGLESPHAMAYSQPVRCLWLEGIEVRTGDGLDAAERTYDVKATLRGKTDAATVCWAVRYGERTVFETPSTDQSHTSFTFSLAANSVNVRPGKAWTLRATVTETDHHFGQKIVTVVDANIPGAQGRVVRVNPDGTTDELNPPVDTLVSEPVHSAIALQDHKKGSRPPDLNLVAKKFRAEGRYRLLVSAGILPPVPIQLVWDVPAIAGLPAVRVRPESDNTAHVAVEYTGPKNTKKILWTIAEREYSLNAWLRPGPIGETEYGVSLQLFIPVPVGIANPEGLPNGGVLNDNLLPGPVIPGIILAGPGPVVRGKSPKKRILRGGGHGPQKKTSPKRNQ